MVTKFKLHQIFNGKDSVVGSFEVKDNHIVFPTIADEYACDIFPAGKISGYTHNKITELLNNKTKSMWLEKVK